MLLDGKLSLSEYTTTADDTGNCPSDYSAITSEQECMAIASNLCDNGFLGTGTWSVVNSGCFVYPSTTKSECMIFFNKADVSGQNDANYLGFVIERVIFIICCLVFCKFISLIEEKVFFL